MATISKPYLFLYVEETLSKIFKEILNLEQIYNDDNFFENGGNSILAMKLYNKIEKTFSTKIKIADIYSNPSIEELALLLDDSLSEINKEVQLSYVEFLDEYLLEDKNENLDNDFYEINISESMVEKLKKIAAIEKINIDNILLSLFLYLLFNVTKNQEIKINTILNKKDRIESLKISIDEIENISQLFKLVSEKLNLEIKKDNKINYLIQDFNRKKDNDIAIIFLSKEITITQPEILKLFNLKVEINKRDTDVSIEFSFDKEVFRKEKNEELVQNYMNLINKLMNSYKNQ